MDRLAIPALPATTVPNEFYSCNWHNVQSIGKVCWAALELQDKIETCAEIDRYNYALIYKNSEPELYATQRRVWQERFGDEL